MHAAELEFGADEALDSMREDIQARMSELTGGKGCDVYIEASGSPGSVCTNGGIRGGGQGGLECDRDGKELIIKGSHLAALTYGSAIEVSNPGYCSPN